MHESLRLSVPELPTLNAPIVVAAFWGRGDRSGSATQAMRQLRGAWQATELATIDPERFYDLTVARPEVRLTGGEREIRWPGMRFHVARPQGSRRDVVLLYGREPHLRWREYAELVADFMQTVGANQFLVLGTRPGLVPHTRPAPLVLSDADEDFVRLFPLSVEPGRTDGWANIQTVVMVQLRGLGIPTARLIAVTPAYVNGGPQPRAMLALIEQVDAVLGSTTDVGAVREAIPVFDQQVIDAAEDEGELRVKLRHLEEQYDASFGSTSGPSQLPDVDELMRGIEELLGRPGEDDSRGKGSD
jgi:PAC2 family protein